MSKLYYFAVPLLINAPKTYYLGLYNISITQQKKSLTISIAHTISIGTQNSQIQQDFTMKKTIFAAIISAITPPLPRKHPLRMAFFVSLKSIFSRF